MAQCPAGLYSRLDQAFEPEGGTASPQQSQVTLPPQQATNTSTPQTKLREKYKLVLYRFGVTEIVLGVLSVVLCIVTLIIASTKKTYVYHSTWNNRTYDYRIRYSVTYASHGIWCGGVVIASGILGFKARGKPSVCFYNANMAVSIVASCFMATLCIMSAICAGDTYPRKGNGGIIAVDSIMAVIGFAGMNICIIHSAYCCAGVCCRKKPQGVVVYAAHPAYPQQQMVQLANGQFIMIPAQGYAPGTSYYPGTQMPPQPGVAVPPYPQTANSQMTKEQEAQANQNPPEYTAHASHNPSV
uniref:uncharacterized protein LOC120348146 n=1 Tax=Styela clava TaxID=7725 RepID=UPI0019395A20|nr:uncharacterized protein LOC120348146 [Styela clava]